MKYISASKLIAYRQCPKRCKEELAAENDQMKFGETIHAAIAGFLEKGLPLMQTWAEILATTDLELVAYKDRAAKAFEAFNRFEYRPESIVAVESNDGETEKNGKKMFRILLDEDIGIQGIIDYIDVLEDGRMRIIDWKTGFSQAEDDLQLAIYAIAAYLKYGFDHIETGFYYLEQNGYYTKTMWGIQEIEAAKKYTIELAKQYFADITFAPKLNPHCHSCGLRGNCEAFNQQLATVPNVDEWNPSPTLENLPVIVEKLQKIEAILKAATTIKDKLVESQIAILKEHGEQTINGRTYYLAPGRPVYNYDLAQIYIRTKEEIGINPPLSICEFSNSGFEEFLKTLPANQRRCLKKIKESARTVKSQGETVKIKISKKGE